MKKQTLLVTALVSLMAANTATAADPVIKVTLLGTGVPLLNADALNANGRALSGLLVEAGSERMLFDCGQGVYNRLVESGGGYLNPNVGVDKVFLSHLHSDHIADLAPLYAIGALYRHPDATGFGDKGLSNYPFPTTTPLQVWGPGAGPHQPVGTWAMMQSFRNAYESDFHLRDMWGGWNASLGYEAINTLGNTTELSEGVAYENNGVKVTAFTVNHAPVTPSFGFRVDYKGHSVVYSGDTAPTDNLVKNSKGVDILVHEVYGYARAASPKIYDYHTSPEDAATIFNKTEPKQAVYTHLVVPPGTTPDDLKARTRAAGYKGKLALGVDLMTIAVNADDTVTVTQPTTAKAQNAKKATSDFIEVVQPHEAE
ncbi:MAG: MBL fold metallo-hydrolase [Methylococcaceae bacterium]|nr:MAG: MBL fold metallo-hydrolase [Methylococcaceae bacterium]